MLIQSYNLSIYSGSENIMGVMRDSKFNELRFLPSKIKENSDKSRNR